MRGKYLSVFVEDAESIDAYMEKMANWGFFVVQNRLRIRGKYLNAFGEYADRIYAYMEKTQRDS